MLFIKEENEIPNLGEGVWWQEYRKTKNAQAIKMDVPFRVKSLEGTVEGKAGDMLMKGIKGELYICEKNIFLESYATVFKTQVKQESDKFKQYWNWIDLETKRVLKEEFDRQKLISKHEFKQLMIEQLKEGLNTDWHGVDLEDTDEPLFLVSLIISKMGLDEND